MAWYVHGGGQSEAQLEAKRRVLRDHGRAMREQTRAEGGRGVGGDLGVDESSSFKKLRKWLRGECGKLSEYRKQGHQKLHAMWGHRGSLDLTWRSGRDSGGLILGPTWQADTGGFR